MKPITIAVAAIKGGVGKSTFAWALGTYLSEQGRVLLWDNDPQATLTSSVASDFTRTAHDVLTGKCRLADATGPALPRYGPSLSIVPAGPALAGLEAATAADLDRQYMIADALAGVEGFIVIDSPAGQGILTTASMVAADFVVTPVACQPAAFETLEPFEQLVSAVRRRLNPGLQWLIAPTMFDGRQVLDRDVLDAIRVRHGDAVLDPPIRKRVSISEDMAAQRPCGHQDFEILIHNFIKRIHYHDQETLCAPRGPQGGVQPR